MSKFGLTDSQNQLIKEILFHYLNKKEKIRIFVFGSRAKGTNRQYSDIDLWIDATPELMTSEIAELYSLFDESDLPIKVDIVTPGTCLEEYKNRIQSELVEF